MFFALRASKGCIQIIFCRLVLGGLSKPESVGDNAGSGSVWFASQSAGVWMGKSMQQTYPIKPPPFQCAETPETLLVKSSATFRRCNGPTFPKRKPRGTNLEHSNPHSAWNVAAMWGEERAGRSSWWKAETGGKYFWMEGKEKLCGAGVFALIVWVGSFWSRLWVLACNDDAVFLVLFCSRHRSLVIWRLAGGSAQVAWNRRGEPAKWTEKDFSCGSGPWNSGWLWLLALAASGTALLLLGGLFLEEPKAIEGSWERRSVESKQTEHKKTKECGQHPLMLLKPRSVESTTRFSGVWPTFGFYFPSNFLEVPKN